MVFILFKLYINYNGQHKPTCLYQPLIQPIVVLHYIWLAITNEDSIDILRE